MTKRAQANLLSRRLYLFFASSLAEYVTGEVMDVNGGMHIDRQVKRPAMGTDGMHGGLAQGIEDLVELGALAGEALMAATRYAALVCGREETIGTPEPGKAADMIGVKGNPSGDIRGPRKGWDCY